MLKGLLRSFLEKLNNMAAAASPTTAANEARKRVAEETVETVMTTAEEAAAKRPRKPKNVKYAMLLSYQGQNYFGMQYQREEKKFPTIESSVLRALQKHGFITEAHMADLFPWHFQRAGRTDRSVSAVRQICSMLLPMDQKFIDDGPALLNGSLPDDIRVMGIKRTTPSFHAQKTCDGRTYSYTMPTFALASCDQVTTDAYRITPERLAEVEELLSCFVGTHNFFNYTSQMMHSDQRVKRNIHEIKCEQPFLYRDPIRQRDVEFVSIYIKGQSFILHQIRKMIGIVLAILRGFLYKSDITRSFQAERMDIPRAPGLGLLLERLHYNRYEKQYGTSHGSLNDWGEQIEQNILEWRDRMIVQRILSEECRTQTMMKWLSSLPLHEYILDPEDITGANISPLQQAARNALSAMKPEDPLLALREIGGEEAAGEIAELTANGQVEEKQKEEEEEIQDDEGDEAEAAIEQKPKSHDEEKEDGLEEKAEERKAAASM